MLRIRAVGYTLDFVLPSEDEAGHVGAGRDEEVVAEMSLYFYYLPQRRRSRRASRFFSIFET